MDELKKIFEDAKKKIGDALNPDMKGEYNMNDMYVLVKDLAHTGGKKAAPISIMRAGTIFYKQKEGGYYSDGFHLIASHIAAESDDYFKKLDTND